MSMRAGSNHSTIGWAGLAALVAIGMSITSCGRPAASPTDTPPIPVPSQTIASSPTESPSPQPILSPQVPTASPQADLPTPIMEVSMGQIFELKWSPDSRWMAYKTKNEDQVNQGWSEGYNGPSIGDVHFKNVQEDRECSYPAAGSLRFDEWFAWQPDSSLLVLDDQNQLVQLTSGPCASQSTEIQAGFPVDANEIISSSKDTRWLLARGETSCWIYDRTAGQSSSIPECSRQVSFSPSGERFGMTLTADHISHTSVVYLAATSEEIARLDWEYTSGGLGSLPAPDWLGEKRILINRSDQGPMVLDFGDGQPGQSLVSDMAGLSQSGNIYAQGSWQEGSAGYHLLINDLDTNHLLLFHGEDSSIEDLGGSSGEFSPDGQMFSFLESITVEGYERHLRWVREVDPPGREAKQLSGLEQEYLVGFSNQWQVAAVSDVRIAGQETQITTVRLPGMEPFEGWLMPRGQSYYPLAWSPDLRWLAVVGSTVETIKASLYLLSSGP